MVLVTVTEFRNNLSKYLELAFSERIALKSKRGIIELNPSKEIRLNPSPSGDPYWDVPENLNRLNKDLKELKSADTSQFKSWDELQMELGI